MFLFSVIFFSAERISLYLLYIKEVIAAFTNQMQKRWVPAQVPEKKKKTDDSSLLQAVPFRKSRHFVLCALVRGIPRSKDAQ